MSCFKRRIELKVTNRCFIFCLSFQLVRIKAYLDKIKCDVLPLETCHMIFCQLWEFDRDVIHGGRDNIHLLEKDFKKIQLLLSQFQEKYGQVTSNFSVPHVQVKKEEYFNKQKTMMTRSYKKPHIKKIWVFKVQESVNSLKMHTIQKLEDYFFTNLRRMMHQALQLLLKRRNCSSQVSCQSKKIH